MEHPDKSEQALRCSQNCANTSHIICGTPPGLKETSIEYQELTQSDTENHRVALRKTSGDRSVVLFIPSVSLRVTKE